MRRTRLLRGSLLVVMATIAILMYSWISDPRKVRAPVWDPESYRWKRESYFVHTDGPVVNDMLENIQWQIQLKRDDMCDSNSSLALAFVMSTVGNFHKRDLIRQTWAHPDLHNHTRIKAMFVLGRTENTTIQEEVDEEATTHDDILQITTLDSYRNLTYKTISALSWIQDWCTELPWIMKIDDDVVVNPFNLRKFLEREIVIKPGLTNIYGRVRRNAKPWVKGKWMVQKNEYSAKLYPTFVLGSAYIIGRNTVDKLLAYVPFTPFLWLEDVFTTGLLARRAEAQKTSMEKGYFINKPSRRIVSGKAIFYIGANENNSNTTWKKILEYNHIFHLNENG